MCRELERFCSLMVLGVARLRAPWDPSPLATDACETGYAVMEGEPVTAEAEKTGRWDERWRFKRRDGSEIAPRARALGSYDLEALDVLPAVEGEAEMNSAFEEVPTEMLLPGRWREAFSARFMGQEAMHLKECRALLSAVKRHSRDATRHGRRSLILCDNTSVVLAVAKGRCCSGPELVGPRRACRSRSGAPARCGAARAAQAGSSVGTGGESDGEACPPFGEKGFRIRPRTSLLWVLPMASRLVRQSRVRIVDLGMCQYGTPWKKPTRLMVWGPRKQCACSNASRPIIAARERISATSILRAHRRTVL